MDKKTYKPYGKIFADYIKQEYFKQQPKCLTCKELGYYCKFCCDKIVVNVNNV